jgi:hypothetical protein
MLMTSATRARLQAKLKFPKEIALFDSHLGALAKLEVTPTLSFSDVHMLCPRKSLLQRGCKHLVEGSLVLQSQRHMHASFTTASITIVTSNPGAKFHCHPGKVHDNL